MAADSTGSKQVLGRKMRTSNSPYRESEVAGGYFELDQEGIRMETSLLNHQAERTLPSRPSLLIPPPWRPPRSHASLNCQIRWRFLSPRKITISCPRSKILPPAMCQHRGMQVVTARFCVSVEPISLTPICLWSLRNSLRSGEPDQILQSRGSANRVEVHPKTKL